MTKLNIIPGPAFCAASAVSTKIPVPMMAPIPSIMTWKVPSERCNTFECGGTADCSRDLTRQSICADRLRSDGKPIVWFECAVRENALYPSYPLGGDGGRVRRATLALMPRVE